MAICELCGRTEDLFRARIEGVELSVCQNCVRHGVIIQRPQIDIENHNSENWSSKSFSSFSKTNTARKEWKIADDFSALLRSTREKSKLSQEDFARFLQEKESMISKWETGAVKPSLETAQKLQKQLGIKLVVLDEAVETSIITAKKSNEFTLGDFIKVKQK